MSKNNKKKINHDNKVNRFFQKINANKYTILEQFRLFLDETPSVQDIVGFLAVQNARLIPFLGNHGEKLTPEMADEVYEFYDYFMDNYDDLTIEARLSNWENDALILRVGADLEEFFMEQEEQAFLDSLTDKQKQEAKTLADTIMAIRKDKLVTFNTMEESWQMYIPAVLSKTELNDCKYELYGCCAEVICEFGAITVRTADRNGRRSIFGIRVLAPYQVWSPISKEDMLDAHTLAPDGTRLAPEEGLTYTEIMRERF